MEDNEVLTFEKLNSLSHEELKIRLIKDFESGKLTSGNKDNSMLTPDNRNIKITTRNIIAVKYITKNSDNEMFSPMGNMDFKYKIGETAICNKGGLFSFPQSRLKLNGKPKLENKIYRVYESSGVVCKYIVIIPRGCKMLVANGGEIISDKLKILSTYSHWKMIIINIQNLLQLKFKI